MREGLVSVILPVWKPDLTRFKKCVDSLVNQTYSNLEIIIIYRKNYEFDKDFNNLISQINDTRIKVIEDKNQGFPSALNEGIMHSFGEFIARIDADDYCENDRIKKQLEFKKNQNCNVVGSWAYYISKDGKKIGKKVLPITHNDIRKKIMSRNQMLHPTILMDRKMLDDIGLYDPNYVSAEDYELWLRAMSKNYKFSNIPEYLVNIGIQNNHNSITRGSQWRKVRTSSLKVKNKAFRHYGFFKPRDVLNYLPTPLYYFISPKVAMKVRNFINSLVK